MNLDELLDLFNQFNAQYFGSQLQIRSIEFRSLGEGHMGRYDPKTNQILINEGLCDQQQRITLLHEMIHKQFEQTDFHGEDFQASLLRCAEISCFSFRQVILLEREIVKDIDRFGQSRCARVKEELQWLMTENSNRPWAEIRQNVLKESGLNGSEFAEIEEWSCALWDFLRGVSCQNPAIPTVCRQGK